MRSANYSLRLALSAGVEARFFAEFIGDPDRARAAARIAATHAIAAKWSGYPVLYRGCWWITYCPPPIPTRSSDWHFQHDDYDHDGDPDAPLDPRAGSGPTFADVLGQIDEMMAEGVE